MLIQFGKYARINTVRALFFIASQQIPGNRKILPLLLDGLALG